MSRYLKTLLTERTGPDGFVLFRSGRELAKQLSQIEHFAADGRRNSYFNKLESASTYINQAFRDHRPLPLELRLAIHEAVIARLEKVEATAKIQWIELVGEALENTTAEKYKEHNIPDDVVTRAIELAVVSKDICLVYTGSIGGIGDLGAYRHILLQKLGLIDRTLAPPSARFTFIEPSIHHCHAGWRRFFYHVVGASPDPAAKYPKEPKEAARIINELDTNNYIRIFHAPRIATRVPLLVLNPLRECNPQDDQGCHGFVMVVNEPYSPEKTDISALEMPCYIMESWKEDFFHPITSERPEENRVWFKDVEKQLLEDVRGLYLPAASEDTVSKPE